MKRLVLAAWLLCIACKTEEPHPAAPAAKKEETKTSGEVTLDAQGQRTAGIQVEPVVSTSVPQTVAANGVLTYNEDETWTAGALMEGRVVSVAAKLGDSVRKDQVLAGMHSHEVHDARADYRKSENEIAGLQGAEAQAKRTRDRVARLLALKSASQQELETAEGELRRAQTALSVARTELERHRVHIKEFLEVPIEEDEHEKPGHADDAVPIRSPGTGIVVERKVSQGSVVSAGDPAFRISNLRKLWLIASVNEADLRYLRAGQQVRVSVRAFPDRSFAGQVLRLGEEFDAATRTLKVRVAVPNPTGQLKPEMFATVELARQDSRAALYTSASALQDLNGSQMVFVESSPGKFVPRAVQTQQAADNRVQVLAGLAPGEKVVTRGAFILKSQMLKSSLQEE